MVVAAEVAVVVRLPEIMITVMVILRDRLLRAILLVETIQRSLR